MYCMMQFKKVKKLKCFDPDKMFWFGQNVSSDAKYNARYIRIVFFVQSFTRVEFPCPVLPLLLKHLESSIKIVQSTLSGWTEINYIQNPVSIILVF